MPSTVVTVGCGDVVGDGLGRGDAVGACESVGYAVEEPAPHAQHIAVAVKSSSLYMPQVLGKPMYDAHVRYWVSSALPSVLTQIVGDEDIDGLGVGAGDVDGRGVGKGVDPVGRGVGYAVEEPPPHAQHTAVAVKSSSSYMPHQLGLGS